MNQKPPASDTSTVPESTATGRTLVLCFDGTSEQYNGYDTNPVKLFALLKKNDFREQLCYYQPGIGTYLTPGAVSPALEWCAKVLDLAFAIYLKDHVMDGYRFLMNNYRAGDKICIFGFSRGSYTARALAGMLHKVGLLPRDNEEQIPFAFKMYQKTSAAGIQMAVGYKQTFCQNVQVEFLGVWETVASVGVIMGRTLPYTSVNSSVKTFRHAVSLDEHRVRFQPYLLEPKPDGIKLGSEEFPTDSLEVWFCGTHTDVGGGVVADGIDRSLSDITLRWMVRQIMASTCGIQFDKAALERAAISPILSPEASSVAASPEEQGVDDADSSEPLHDDLTGFSLWRLLEILPLTWSVQDVKGAWHTKFGLHLSKGRSVVDPNPNFHFTVKERMANSTLKYHPKAQWVAGTEVYVN
ncbi:hypothetical protein DFH08DRAFT_279685 [Mycena albidolilacea]|uniref:T6SS Phospholipase effector Tle1-like catalytic domain-containing protein n=1 Tax=Mycena albidolilacea TaxID=1033008 RepID=A0AAD7AQJ8_9AGAR|nr:hypothetical protein DFH08DRAFT_279685 [Mycena albidolilacea]